MEGQNHLQTIIIQYQNLQAPPQLNEELLIKLDQHIKGPWQGSFQCITVIRSICKYYPQHIPNLFEKYGPAILHLFTHATTQLLKNILKMLGQIFNCGVEVNLEGCVNAFLPMLLKKGSMQTGQLKTFCQQILTIIASKCCYCNTIELTVEAMVNKQSKNEMMKELALQLLAGILNSLSQSLTQINPSTLRIIMQGMYQLIVGKRNNMKNSALDACIFIYNQIGSENYLQLMNFSLNQQAVLQMGQAMEQHRTQKIKAPQFSEVIKQQKIGMRQSGALGQAHNMRM